MRKALVLLAALATTSAAQTVPIRTIGPILATSTENVGPAINVRATSDGHVIVGAGARQRVYAFDSTLKNFTLIADSGQGTGVLPVRTTGLIPYLGDSTLLPDYSANALLVLDPSGKQVRSMAPPHAQDLTFLGVSSSFGHPGLDSKGRLIYRTMVINSAQMAKSVRMSGDGGPPPPPQPMTAINPDTSPIVRADFDTRSVDTLAWLKTPQQGRMNMDLKQNPAGGPPTVTVHMLINPFIMSDEWALLSDGSVAIIRVHDYHIDWVDPDGNTRSTPKMPIDWRRFTDSEKTHRVDSLRNIIETQIKGMMAKAAAAGPNGPQIKPDIGIVPDSEFPSFWPPVEPGSVLADLDNHIWVLPTTSLNAANGFTYDVINKEGKIFERVQLPKGRVVAGFGPHDVVYMTHADGKVTYLERAVLNPPPK